MPRSKKNISSNGDRRNKRKPKEGGKGSSEFVRIIFSPVSQGIRLPTVFMENHGQSLETDTVIYLKVPTGDSWPIKLKETDTGLWFDRGWKDFAAYYEIEPRDVLLFKYDGHAQFSVNIMDPSGSEIEYPMDVEADNVEGGQEDNVNVESSQKDDVNVESSEEDDVNVEGGREDDVNVEGGEEVKGGEEGDVNVEGGEEEEDDVNAEGGEEDNIEGGEEDDDDEEGSEEDVGEACMSDFDVNPYGLYMGVRGLGEKKKFDSYRKAEGFRSANPFFLSFMQPTYVTDRYMVGLNLNCVDKFLPKDDDQNKMCVLKISVPDSDKVWNMSCHAYLGGQQSAIMKGWKEFAVENKLRVADVCVFELVNPQDLHFNITIFRNT